MRLHAILFGAGTAVCVIAGVSSAPAESGKQLAQAQGSGAQSGTGTGTSQRGSVGSREGGAAASGTSSQERGTATRQSGDGSTTVRSETTRASRTTVRERVGGTRVSVHGGTRRWLACAPRPAMMASSSGASGRAAMSIAGRQRQ
jgi:hypothetical protein